MTALETSDLTTVLTEVATAGCVIHLSPEGDRPQVSPPGRLSDDLKRRLGAHRAELTRLLQDQREHAAEVSALLADLKIAGIGLVIAGDVMLPVFEPGQGRAVPIELARRIKAVRPGLFAHLLLIDVFGATPDWWLCQDCGAVVSQIGPDGRRSCREHASMLGPDAIDWLGPLR